MFWLWVLLFVLHNLNGWCAAYTSTYQRPPAAPPLPLDTPLLKGGNSIVEQVHISLIDAQHISINWVTPRAPTNDIAIHLLEREVLALRQQPCTNAETRTVVQFSTDNTFTNDPVEVEGSFTCYSTGDYDSGLLHTAVIGPLAPATYYYRCGDTQGGWSRIFSFTVPPATTSVRIGFVGDLGQTQYTVSTLNHLQQNAPDLIVNVGDLSYADGEQPRWDSYGRIMQPLASKMPVMVIEGNHEIEDFEKHVASEFMDVDARFIAYETRYSVPSDSTANPSNTPLYYSFDVAGAHIIMLGSYAPNDKDSEQFRWLKDDLASINHTNTPWVFVGMHAPWYNSNTAHQHEADDMQAAMEPLLFEHGVDAVISGHVHAYERFARVYDSKANDCGPVYIIIGDGGNREGLAGDWLDQPDYSLFRESSYGHGMFEVVNATHAHWQWFRNDDDVRQVVDSFWAVRDPSCRNQHRRYGHAFLTLEEGLEPAPLRHRQSMIQPLRSVETAAPRKMLQNL